MKLPAVDCNREVRTGDGTKSKIANTSSGAYWNGRGEGQREARQSVSGEIRE